MDIRIPCIVCKKTQTLRVLELDYEDYVIGKGRIQDNFPYLTRCQREILISGICGKCFDDLTLKDEEEENG